MWHWFCTAQNEPRVKIQPTYILGTYCFMFKAFKRQTCKGRSLCTAQQEQHIKTALLPTSHFTQPMKSFVPSGQTEASVITLSHSLELRIPDVNAQSPWNPQATHQRAWKLRGRKQSKGRQEFSARYPGHLYALPAALQACSTQRVLSGGS